MPETADCVIVGAGVHGASAAFHLSARRFGRIVLIDKGFAGGGNTAQSTALCRIHYSNEPEARLTWESVRWFENWAERVGGECGYSRTGFLRIVGPGDYDNLRRNVAMLRRMGVPTHIVTSEEAARIEPLFRTDDFAIAAHEPDSGYAEPVLTTTSLVEAARRQGVQYRPNTPATRLIAAGGRIQGVETPGGLIEAPVVVLAANSWAPALAKTVGLDLPIVNERHQVAVFERSPDLPRSHVMCIDSTLDMYFRPEGHTLTLIGTGSGQPGADPDTYRQGADFDFLELAARRISARMPVLAEATARRGLAGVYDVSPDGKPLIGPAPGVEGLYVEGGFSGTGFKISPATGLCLAELITKGRAKTVDLTPFRLTRFAEGQPFISETEYTDGLEADGVAAWSR